MAAAHLRWARDGLYVTNNELLSIPTAQLTRAVFGKRKTIDDAFTNYVENGLAEGAEANPQKK
jgi:hypothetical protein